MKGRAELAFPKALPIEYHPEPMCFNLELGQLPCLKPSFAFGGTSSFMPGCTEAKFSVMDMVGLGSGGV